MIFLIRYHRTSGRLVRMWRFEESDRRQSEAKRLELEFTLNHEGLEDEVVILEAPNEAAIRRTHRRYFESLGQLLRPPVLSQA